MDTFILILMMILYMQCVLFIYIYIYVSFTVSVCLVIQPARGCKTSGYCSLTIQWALSEMEQQRQKHTLSSPHSLQKEREREMGGSKRGEEKGGERGDGEMER